MTNLKEDLLRYSHLATQYLQAMKFDDDKIDQMYHYAIDGGNRLRPALVSLSAEVVGGNPENIFYAAAAIELMHKSAVIHDDIIDEDEFRRKRKAFHAMFGAECGILMGDLLVSLAFDTLSRLYETHTYDDVIQCYKLLSQSANNVCIGQLLDCLFEELSSISWERYIEMISKKSSSLLEKSLQIGGILGGANQSDINFLTDYGRNIGIAFQLRNDIDNIINFEDAGRKRGSDILKKKKTCLVLKTLEIGCQKDRELLLWFTSQPNYSEDDINRIIAMFEENGAISNCQDMVKKYAHAAKRSLEGVKEGKAKEILLQLAFYAESDHHW
jgi:geranylgeranyl diphosphate synthase type I